jgi:SAM-dependent methyltransferase
MNVVVTLDPIWEEKYSQGHAERYPWDIVVSFVFRNYPRHKERHEIKILEIGCGTGSNLWFAAREGFQVSGIDGSFSAIEYAKKRFEEEGLTGDLRVGDFTQLPFESDSFDLVIDRGAIVCCGLSAGQTAVAEVRRVLQVGGKFLCNPYSDRHSSYVSGKQGADGLRVEISDGTLTGVGQICFYGRQNVETLFAEGWNILSLQHLEWTEQSQPKYTVHAEWRVIAKKN